MHYSILLLFYLSLNAEGLYQPRTYRPFDKSELRTVKCSGYNITKVGCYHERDESRPDLPLAVPELLLNTDKTSTKYVGYERSTFQTYDDFLARFVCDCANRVRSRGYTHFSLKNFFECWSGRNVAKTYNIYRDGDGCISGDKKQCNVNTFGICAGTGRVHFTYEMKSVPLAPTNPGITTPTTLPTSSTRRPDGTLTLKCGTAEYKLRKLGCFTEQERSRAFPELILTATDAYNRKYAGYYLDTKNYETFLKRFACDCVARIRAKTYSVFGLQSYGQCWSGPNVRCSFNKYGRTSGCINQQKWNCSDDNSMLCSSTNTKSIYALVLADFSGGAICPTPTTTPPPSITTITTSVPAGPPAIRCGNLRYKLTKLGCWSELGDSQPPRGIPDLLLTARDKSSDVYAGYQIDMNNYATFLERFVCDCVTKVKSKRYSVFGIQFYGECWSGPKAACTYRKFGKIQGCIDEKMKTCSDASSRLCSSDTADGIYAYVPADTPGGATCPTKSPTTKATPPTTKTTPTLPSPLGPPAVKCGNINYKLTKLGCWKELGDSQPPRAIPDLLLTARDKSSGVYAGYDLDFYNYASFLERFVCDCVSKVKRKGYSVFGIQFYGECWSGPRASCTYQKFGRNDGCVDDKMTKCSDDSSRLCSGNSAQHVYVYVPADIPGGATCPATSPTPKTKPTPSITTPTTPVPTGPPVVKCGNIEYKLRKLGCWKELGNTRPPRAISELLLTAKDKKSSVYVGYDLHKIKYDAFLQRFVCDCVTKVKNKGYSVFGIQFYGECWSGPRAGCTYQKFGRSKGCVNQKLTKCSDASSRLCAGHSSQEVYVYAPANVPDDSICPTTSPTPIKTPTPSITTPTTPIPIGPPTVRCRTIEYKLTKLGCWRELGDIRPPRAIPELLLTARDPKSSVYVGYQSQKLNYDTFIPRFVCDCITTAKSKGYSVFGIQFYGECWSGPRAGCTYQKFGRSLGCVNEKFTTCSDATSRLCAGHSSQEVYVYVPANSPDDSICPTTSPTPVTSPTPSITTVPTGPPIVKCRNVEYKLTKLGCWKELGDIRPPRAISELLLTARDPKSSVYVGYQFQNMKYDTFIQRFVCDCFTKANNKGYSVFGIQFYGECWSGPRAGCTYQKFGRSRSCVSEKQTACSDASSRLCAGHSSQEVYVYVPANFPEDSICPTPPTTTSRTTPTSTSVTTPIPLNPPVVLCGDIRYQLKKLGCWYENGDRRPPRAIPELLLTARDINSKVYAGYQFSRSTYSQFLERFVCDCVSKVNNKGYSIFGIQFYGECWSGPDVKCTYQKFGKVDRCVNEQMRPCSDESSMLCSGDGPRHTYVYVRSDIPFPTCPTGTTTSTVTTRSTPPTQSQTTIPAFPTTQVPSPTTSVSVATTPITTPATRLTTTPTSSPSSSARPTTSTTSPTSPKITPSKTSPVTPSSTITTPTSPPPRGFECTKALDIVIAIDASGSVMQLPFQRIRSFVNNLSIRFVSVEPTYFGLLHYNYNVVTSATLAERLPNTQRLRNLIDDMKYLGQATLTQKALVSAKTLFDNGARNDSNVGRILILFTDGRTYGGKQTLREPLKRLREIGVRVTVVAVGSPDYLDRYSLSLIAENESNLVIIPSLQDLSGIERDLDRVTFMVCPR